MWRRNIGAPIHSLVDCLMGVLGEEIVVSNGYEKSCGELSKESQR